MFQFVFDTRLFKFNAEAPTWKPLLQLPPANRNTGLLADTNTPKKSGAWKPPHSWLIRFKTVSIFTFYEGEQSP